MSREPPAPDTRSDEALIALAARGDEAAFASLYHRHKDFVWRVARRFADDDGLALDASQETFAYLFSRLTTLELRSRLTTLLYPVARNAAIALRRARRSVPSAERAVMADPVVALPSPSSASESRAALAAALAALSETHREVIVLRFIEEMSLDDIAAALDIPLGTVKSRLHNALADLREDPRTRSYFAE